MKTETLIDVLSKNVEPINPGLLRNTLVIALLGGAAVAVGLMFILFGVPARAFGGADFRVRMLVLAFVLAMIAAGTSLLIRSARPGNPGRRDFVLIGLLLAGLLCAGIVALGRAPPATWGPMLFGPQWGLCVICIPLFALAPFGALIWVLRRAAPTHPIIAGAATGLVAAALGAAVYSCCGPGGSVAFVTLWYGGAILLCAAVGAAVGPRLLRWR